MRQRDKALLGWRLRVAALGVGAAILGMGVGYSLGYLLALYLNAAFGG
jgi:hypothetical protein